VNRWSRGRGVRVAWVESIRRGLQHLCPNHVSILTAVAGTSFASISELNRNESFAQNSDQGLDGNPDGYGLRRFFTNHPTRSLDLTGLTAPNAQQA
jgi:hypothetical protein